MNQDNTAVQMLKGILEYCVLYIISRGEVYASDLLAELTEAKLVVVEGTLYPLLSRLKNAELLTYRWVESASGPPRKYYSLTEKGSEAMEQMDETWQKIAQAVAIITNNSTPTTSTTTLATQDV